MFVRVHRVDPESAAMVLLCILNTHSQLGKVGKVPESIPTPFGVWAAVMRVIRATFASVPNPR